VVAKVLEFISFRLWPEVKIFQNEADEVVNFIPGSVEYRLANKLVEMPAGRRASVDWFFVIVDPKTIKK
jgi:hypothetical protein